MCLSWAKASFWHCLANMVISDMTPNQPHQTNTHAIIGLFIGCLLFGLGSVIVAHLSVGSYALAFWRLVVSSVIFVVLSKIFGHAFPTHKKSILFALLAGVALGIDLGLWHESVHAVGPGISTLLNSLQIFFLAFLGFVIFGQRQTKLQLVSLVLAVIGVAMIGSPEFRQNAHALWGFVSGIVSGLCLALSMIFIRQTHSYQSVPVMPLMALVGVGGAVALLPLMLVFDVGQILPASLSEVGWILVYGSVMQCVAFGLIAYCVPRLNLTLTGLILLSEPVAALVIDYFWLDKPIVGVQWVGAFLTMEAIYLGSVATKSH